MNRIELARTIDALAIESQRRLSPNLGEASLEIRARGLDSQGTALAVAAFTEALRRGKASIRTPHHDERANCIAAASAMAEGMMVISERAALLSDYVELLACYLGALQGRRVNALTSTASDSESLNKSWVAVWSQLGITHERLVNRNTGTDGRRIYSNEIVLGGYEQFCDDYLADQFAKNITQWVGAAHDLAIVRNAGVVLPDMDRRLVQVSLPGPEGAVAGRIPGSDYLLLYRGVAALAPSVESWQSLPRRYDGLPTVLLAESERPIPPRESGSIPDLSGLATDLERMDREQAYQLRRETLLGEKDPRDIVLFQFDSLISHILETTPPARVNDKYRALLGPGNPTLLYPTYIPGQRGGPSHGH